VQTCAAHSTIPTLHQQLLYTHATPPLSAASATPSIVTFLSQLLLFTVTPQLCTRTSSGTPQYACNSLVSCQCYSLYRYFSLSATPLHCYSSAVPTLHQQLHYTHATPPLAPSATPSVVTFLSQLLLFTVTPQLYPHFISNSSTRMQLPCQLPVLLPL
jgi:hypothetical protein